MRAARFPPQQNISDERRRREQVRMLEPDTF